MRFLSVSQEAAARLCARLAGVDRRWRIAAWVVLVGAVSTVYYASTLGWPVIFRGRGGLRATGSLEPGDTFHIVRDVIIDDSLGGAGFKRWFTDRIGRGPNGLHPGDSLSAEDTLRIIREGTVNDELGERRFKTWFAQAWNRGGTARYYRPIMMMSCWVDYRLWGGRSLGYRVTSLLLHIGCCLLLGFVVSKMARSWWPGAAAGVVFALWPENAEVVTWIGARGDLLLGIFTLGALAMLLCIGPAGERAGWLWPLSLLAFLLALGSKETAIALPLLLAVWMFMWPIHRRPAARALVVLSFAVVVPAFWFVREQALGAGENVWPSIGELLRFNVLRHYAAFIARPPVDLVLAIAAPHVTASPLRADIWALFDPNVWRFLGREALWFGAAALLLVTCLVPALAFVAWKVVLYLTVLPTQHFWAWPHRFYWPSMGQAALVGLVLWQAALLACRWWPRLAAWLRRIEFRPTT